MVEKLLEAVPEFKLIEDIGLREMCLECWLRGIDLGEWTFEEVLEIPFTLQIETKVSLVEHTRGVTLLADAMAGVINQLAQDDLKVNHQYVIAGALLHDVGKLLEMEEVDGTFRKSADGKLVRHPFSGVALADANGVPATVLHIIGTHSKEGDPYKRTPEAIILHYADFMNFDPIEEIHLPRG